MELVIRIIGIITPVLIVALAVLGGSAVLAPVGGYSVSTAA